MIIIYMLNAIIWFCFTEDCGDTVFDDGDVNPYERGFYFILMLLGVGLTVFNLIQIGVTIKELMK